MLKKIASYIVVLVVGVVVGTYFDAKHTIEEKVVFKDRVKTVVKERITEAPDGTRIIERETTKKEKKDGQVSRVESKPARKEWGVSVKADLIGPAGFTPTYTLELHRRILGELYVSAYGRTDSVAGVGVTLFF